MKMSVYFVQGMSAVVEVDVPDGEPETAIEQAAQLVNFQPCHQCAGSFEQDGDFDALYVNGPDGEPIWEARAEQAATVKA